MLCKDLLHIPFPLFSQCHSALTAVLKAAGGDCALLLGGDTSCAALLALKPSKIQKPPVPGQLQRMLTQYLLPAGKQGRASPSTHGCCSPPSPRASLTYLVALRGPMSHINLLQTQPAGCQYSAHFHLSNIYLGIATREARDT